MTTHAIYSSGGFGREIRRYAGQHVDCDEVVFVDDNSLLWGSVLNGSRVMSYEELLEIEDVLISVAFADPSLRRAKTEQTLNDGLKAFSIFAPTCTIGENVSVGQGAVFADYSMVTADAEIGRGFHANIYSYVAHDCRIGDFVTLAPRVSLNGRIIVEDRVYIGSDATFLPGSESKPLTVGMGATIGAGAVVTKDVPPGVTVVGAPARALSK